jgi:hypothetical protein
MSPSSYFFRSERCLRPRPRDEELVLERDRPLLFDDDVERRVGPDRPDPVGHRFQVGHRRRKGEDPDMLRREDDGLLPDGAALDVVQVVDLVEDDVAHVVERLGRLEDRVAEDLRGHQDDLGVRVERDVAGLDADAVAVDLAEVAELLVGERLDGGGVEDARALGHALLDRVLRDERLPRPGGGGDDEGLLVVDDADGLFLERV